MALALPENAPLPDLEAPVMEVNATEAARQIKDSAHERVQTKAKAADAKVNATIAQSAADALAPTEAQDALAAPAAEATVAAMQAKAGGGAPPPGGGGGGGKPQPGQPGYHIAKWNATAECEWDPAKVRTRLTKWANAVKVSTTTHGVLATSLEQYERRLSLVLVTINAIIGGSIFTSISDSPLTIYLQVLAGVLSIFAAMLTAWKTELKWAERSEGHRNAARGFEKISHRFVKQLDMVQLCPLDEEGKLLKEWSEIIQAWEELESESPQIPAADYDKCDAKTRDRQIGRGMIYININDLEIEIKAKGKETTEDKKMLDRLKKLDKNQDGILEVHEMLSTIYQEKRLVNSDP